MTRREAGKEIRGACEAGCREGRGQERGRRAFSEWNAVGGSTRIMCGGLYGNLSGRLMQIVTVNGMSSEEKRANDLPGLTS